MHVVVAGTWKFYAGKTLLKSGSLQVTGSHHMMLMFNDNSIYGWIDQKMIFEVKDSTFNAGWAALGSSYDYVEFDDFELNRIQ